MKIIVNISDVEYTPSIEQLRSLYQKVIDAEKYPNFLCLIVTEKSLGMESDERIVSINKEEYSKLRSELKLLIEGEEIMKPIEIIIHIKNKDIVLTVEEANEIFNQLKMICDKSGGNSPVYPTPIWPMPDPIPYNPNPVWCKTTDGHDNPIVTHNYEKFN